MYHEGVGVVSLSLLSFFSSTQVILAGPQPGADRGDTPRAATLRARQQACLGIRDRGCILILIWQGDLLGRPICTDPSSLAPCVVPLCAKGQLCALLSPLAGLLLCKGSRCCLLVFFLTAFDPPQALSVGAQIQAWLALLQIRCGSSGCRVPGAAVTALHRGQRASSAPWQRQGRSSSCAQVCLPPHCSFLNLFL